MKKILIVEDEQSLLKLLELMFQKGGYEVVKAINAKEAYRAVKEKPDLILLDILLPGENGMSILENLKADKATKDIPVIMLTNFNEPERFALAREKGAADYLVKSSNDPSTVLAKVKKYLESS